MRVLFNQSCTAGNKTGVGHYAQQVLSQLRQMPGESCTGFPSERWLTWDQRFHTWYRTFLALNSRWKKVRHPLAPFKGVFHWSLKQIRQSYQQFFERLHQEAFFGNAFDLYHEPNFIPLPSSLKTVITVHDLSVLLHPEWHPRSRVSWYDDHFSRAIRQSSHIIVVSEFTRRQVLYHLKVPPSKVTTVHNGVRPEFRPLPAHHVAEVLRQRGLPARYLLYVGTIEPRKNILRLMQAYCSLPESLRRDWPLLLVGQWGWNVAPEQAYYQDEARHRGVRQIGYLPDKDLPILYNGARALIYPSLYEGFGFPPLEMLACGGAVLASMIEPIMEVLGDEGHLVEPENTDSWRDAMQRILREDDWWEHLRQGTEESARYFSWQRCARETMQVYRKVLHPEQSKPVLYKRAA